MTAPTGFGRRNIIPLIPSLMADHPELRIELQLIDGITDMVSLGYEVAIRIALMNDSRLVAQRLADNPRVLYASLSYLRKSCNPALLLDLQNHSSLHLAGVVQWGFMVDGNISSLSIDGRFNGGNVEVVRDLCVAGCGIAQLTLWEVRKELLAGDLI